jgi:Phosphoenolpyruvate carboxykinase
MSRFSLSSHGVTVEDVRRNLAPAELYAEAIREEPGCTIADTGALIAYSGAKTGRSPKDKRVVRKPASDDSRRGAGHWSPSGPFWGWVWGGIGLILAFPMITSLRIVLENLETTRGWAVLMSDE